MRQPSRRKRAPRASKRVGDTPTPLLGVPHILGSHKQSQHVWEEQEELLMNKISHLEVDNENNGKFCKLPTFQNLVYSETFFIYYYNCILNLSHIVIFSYKQHLITLYLCFISLLNWYWMWHIYNLSSWKAEAVPESIVRPWLRKEKKCAPWKQRVISLFWIADA